MRTFIVVTTRCAGGSWPRYTTDSWGGTPGQGLLLAINPVATGHYDLCMQIGRGKGALGMHE